MPFLKHLTQIEMSASYEVLWHSNEVDSKHSEMSIFSFTKNKLPLFYHE